ncbi:MAG: 3-isopropylmalate dehydrogenase [Armatimonadota bacterium]
MNVAYKIAVIPGDGIGPEVVREGLKVLDVVAKKYNISFDYETFDWGGDRYLATGEVMPKNGVEIMQQFDAIFLGAVGHPQVKAGIIEHQLLLGLRFGLDQYINLRPVKLYPNVDTPLKDKGPADIDYIVVRENTEDMYVGTGGFTHKGQPNEVATQVAIYTREGVERAVRYAYELAMTRPRKQLTLVDKSNVLTFGHDLWQRVFKEVGAEYPEIKQEHAYVDACCMWMVKNPEWFDVIVTTNMFGDIITDLGAMTQGGMGIAASGNINPKGVSMFEPIHGSAPKYTGKNVINPLATINAASMMLDFLGEKQAAQDVENAIIKALETGKIPHLGAGAIPTDACGDLVASLI